MLVLPEFGTNPGVQGLLLNIAATSHASCMQGMQHQSTEKPSSENSGSTIAEQKSGILYQWVRIPFHQKPSIRSLLPPLAGDPVTPPSSLIRMNPDSFSGEKPRNDTRPAL